MRFDAELVVLTGGDQSKVTTPVLPRTDILISPVASPLHATSTMFCVVEKVLQLIG